MKKIFLLSLFLFNFSFLIFNCSAQQLPLSNQYTINKFSLSPAYAGVGGAFEVFGTYRNDWMNIPGAPETKMISADGLVCKNMGIGGTISSIEAGVFRNQSATFSYAYHLKLGTAQTLSFGLGLGLLESHVDVTSPAAQADPVAANNQNVNSLVPDASFGILYRYNNFSAGISLPRMLGSTIKNADGKTVYALAPQQSVHLGYKYSFNADWAIDPMLKISMVQNAPLFYEIALPVIYKEKIWFTPIYKKSSMAFGLGGIPYNNFIVQYTYEFSSMGIMGQSGGTHEITIGWKMFAKKKSEVPDPDSKKPYYKWISK